MFSPLPLPTFGWFERASILANRGRIPNFVMVTPRSVIAYEISPFTVLHFFSAPKHEISSFHSRTSKSIFFRFNRLFRVAILKKRLHILQDLTVRQRNMKNYADNCEIASEYL